MVQAWLLKELAFVDITERLLMCNFPVDRYFFGVGMYTVCPLFAVPWPHVYGWVNPIQVIFHEPSLLWMLNLSGTMAKHVNSFIRTLPSV